MLTWRDIIFPLNLFLDYEENLLRSVAFLFMYTKLDMNESTNTKIIIASHSQYMKRILSISECLQALSFMMLCSYDVNVKENDILPYSLKDILYNFIKRG